MEILRIFALENVGCDQLLVLLSNMSVLFIMG